MGMKVGGCRKVRISHHLAYRDKGIPDMISPDAVLIYKIWLRDIVSVLLPLVRRYQVIYEPSYLRIVSLQPQLRLDPGPG
jgi:hypothetical protein